jgi:hypothetical protein
MGSGSGKHIKFRDRYPIKQRDRAHRLGFSPDVLQRLGAFAVAWAVFESHLETALWALSDETVAGVHPSTDKKPVSTWIEELAEPWPQFTAKHKA